MPRPKISGIRFRPPIAIARLGDSPSPLEAFTWAEDPRLFGAGQTVIVPRVSLEVLPDGSVEPYHPGAIRFRDGSAIRPVCPFFELEAEFAEGEFKPLTSALLEVAGIELAQLSFEVMAANRKAERRTGDEACRFEARLQVRGDDHARRELRAWSHTQSANPLVSEKHPITLGAFQIIRPQSRPRRFGVALDRIRVRFTPGRGQVYGPPEATGSKASDARRKHTIVPAENRILNPAASWAHYRPDNSKYPQPWPPDTYDGADDRPSQAGWGVVDDTCDAVIGAALATSAGSLTAVARVLVGPPDYAPDRRPFVSLADELADRDPKSLRKPLGKASPQEWHDSVSDLFRRIGETASLVNLDRQRLHNLGVNKSRGYRNEPGFPKIGSKSMTDRDRIEGRHLLSHEGEKEMTPAAIEGANGGQLLVRSEYGKNRHGQLAEAEVLLQFLFEQKDRLRDILRPPFARASELKATSGAQHPHDLRDPRFPRSNVYDMRMPPFMRDCDYSPLSLTRLQWQLLFLEGIPDGEKRRQFEKDVRELLPASRGSAHLKEPMPRSRSREK